MPFTLAHAAAVVPFRRRCSRTGVFAALVIGSMTPDFVYWLPWTISRSASHSVVGIFWFCVPAGLLAYWVCHAILKPPAVLLLPCAVQLRLRSPTPEPARAVSLLRLCVALTLGAATHIIWDAFTHEDGAAVRVFSLLTTALLTHGTHTLRLYKLLQHGSTLVGFGVLAVSVWSWLRNTTPLAVTPVPQLRPAYKIALYVYLGAAAVGAAVVGATLTAPLTLSLAYVQAAVVRGSIAGLGGVVGALFLLGMVWPFLTPKFFP